MTSAQSIARIYERTLYIPQSKPKTQFYLVPVGLVGSGKTTVLKPLSDMLNLVRVSGDEIRHTIIDNGGDLNDTWEIGNQIVRKYAELGFSIAHDTDGATVKTQESIAEQASKYGIKLFWIHISPPGDYIINKLKNYKHSWLFSSPDEAISKYRKRKHLHKNLPMHFIYTFDPSAKNLTDQIQEASKIIQQELNKA